MREPRIENVLGPLGAAVMRAVWQLGEGSVRQVGELLEETGRRRLAYTTTMTMPRGFMIAGCSSGAVRVASSCTARCATRRRSWSTSACEQSRNSSPGTDRPGSGSLRSVSQSSTPSSALG
ncbi:MAG: BlaI/MecI/CopY family transcriptional regulator [Chloroflexi bacterium]|nr:BlaI/MecI/CopY family transcriptional regulator [Chloroflexota bacterium]